MLRQKRLIVPLFLLVVVAVAAWWQFRRQTITVRPTETNITETAQTAPVASQAPITTFDKSRHSLTDPNSPWVIVNKQRPLNSIDYAPLDLTSVGNGHQMRAEAATAFRQLLGGGQAAGQQINPLSGYRSYQRQKTVYQYNVDTYGQADADVASAKPGYSEHQTGLAIDIGGGGCGIEECFGDTPEGKWVATNAHSYGFIIRYPQGQQSITGYKYEPWHIRYVGVELATEMHRRGVLTLEEFFSL